MTREEAINHLKTVAKSAIDSGYDSAVVDAVDMAREALEQEPCDDVCEWFEQYVDIATDIVELRFSDGTVKRAKRGLYMRDIEKSIRKMLIDQMANEKKQEPCDDCISRQAAIDAIWDGINMDIYTREVKERLEHLPSVSTEKTRHCKECKYFDCDTWKKIDGIPLIVAHEVCKKWGRGCKTREDGYCFLFEPQESEVQE